MSWHPQVDRPSRRRALLALFGAWIASRLLAQAPANEAESSKSGRVKLQREGTRVQGSAGVVTESGRGWQFVGEDGSSYRVLENLALQRVVLAIRENSTDRNWIIDGYLTEFLGENFLYIQKLQRDS